MFAEILGTKHRCVILVDEVTIFEVQEFADGHCVKDDTINVTSYCGLVVVAFNTHEKLDDIFKKLQQRFGADFNVERMKAIVSVTKKES